MLRRKIYDKLVNWKEESNGSYALMIEGARRIGKSTIVEEFAKKEYENYILIDFSTAEEAIKSNFENINNLDVFFRNLFTLTSKSLKKRKGLIIFDEIQFFPKARQSIKQLVKDGRYDYIETGSLISINKNVKDILIPSEEESIKMYPMDFEEFLWAIGDNVTIGVIKEAFENRKPLGNDIHRRIMRDFRTYMAVGGMPQAVVAFVEGKDYKQIDRIKNNIIKLYSNDIKKHDSDNNDKAETLFNTLPQQLMNSNSIFKYSLVKNDARARNCVNALEFLKESMVVNICNNVTNPEIALALYKETAKFKMFMGDTGLLVTFILNNGGDVNKMYRLLVIDDLGINQGMIFENIVAQMLTANNHELYFHEFKYKPKNNETTKKYEIDFLTVKGKRIAPIEVKSSSYKNHKSFDYFKEKYQLKMNERFIIYTKDLEFKEGILYIPIYMTCLI